MKKWKTSPWAWIPTLFIAEGLPFVTISTIALVMYKRLGLSNTEVTFYTSLIALPWMLKPLWTPFVEAFSTKRTWSLLMQILITFCLLGIAYQVTQRDYLAPTLAFFWALAFCSATHNISSNSLYNLFRNEENWRWQDHLRRGFFHLSGLLGTGLMVMIAGGLETYYRQIRYSWGITFKIMAVLFALICLYNVFFLPHSAQDKPVPLQLDYRRRWQNFKNDTASFFHRRGAIAAVIFLIFFRLPEALLTKISPLFLLDSPSKGGLGLSTQEVGFASGTIGVLALTLGGLIGARLVSKKGLHRCFWPMVLMVTVPDVLYVLLAALHVHHFGLINLFLFIEQFGCGFGFIAYTQFIATLSRNEFKASHHALYTAAMALGLHIPGFVAGLLQETLGYHSYFLMVLACCMVTLLVSLSLKFENEDTPQ